MNDDNIYIVYTSGAAAAPTIGRAYLPLSMAKELNELRLACDAFPSKTIRESWERYKAAQP